MSYRRQNSDFTRDRKRNASDQILEDLKVKKERGKFEFENWVQRLILARRMQRLTASILSGSERSAAPMPPCKRSEVRHPCHFFTARLKTENLVLEHKQNWRPRFRSNILSAERSMSRRSEGDPKWVRTPQKVTGQFRLRDGRLEETHLGGIFFGTSHVDIDGGHVFLPGWAAAHSFFPPKKDNKRLNTNHSYEHTHTQSCGLTPAGPRSAPCPDQRFPGQKKQEQQKTLNPPPRSVIGHLRCNRCPQSHHLEDNSVLLPLTGPEHDAIIGSDKIHRAQHIWRKCNTTQCGLNGAVSQRVTLDLQQVRDTHRSPPGDTGPSWCQSAPETDRTNQHLETELRL